LRPSHQAVQRIATANGSGSTISEWRCGIGGLKIAIGGSSKSWLTALGRERRSMGHRRVAEQLLAGPVSSQAAAQSKTTVLSP
jgi:hypothetical protein